jgi:hypothetical protein
MVTQVGSIPLLVGQATYLLRPYVAGYKINSGGQNAFTDWMTTRILAHSS